MPIIIFFVSVIHWLFTGAPLPKKSPVQDLHMNGYLHWLINSTPSILPFLESMTSVLSDDTSDDCQETDRGTQT